MEASMWAPDHPEQATRPGRWTAAWLLNAEILWAPAGFRPPGWAETIRLVQDVSGASACLREAVLRHRPVVCCDDGLDLQVGPASSLFPSVTGSELGASEPEVPQGSIPGPASSKAFILNLLWSCQNHKFFSFSTAEEKCEIFLVFFHWF